jgi:hypothetical protein
MIARQDKHTKDYHCNTRKPPVGVVLGLAVGTPDDGFEEGFAKLQENN